MSFLFDSCVADATVGSQTVCWLFNFLIVAILIRALLSWFQLDPRNPMIEALNAITSPIIDPIRSVVPRIMMIDFSPMIAMIILSVLSVPLQQFLIEQGI
jgi:YggT family protein